MLFDINGMEEKSKLHPKLGGQNGNDSSLHGPIVLIKHLRGPY